MISARILFKYKVLLLLTCLFLLLGSSFVTVLKADQVNYQFLPFTPTISKSAFEELLNQYGSKGYSFETTEHAPTEEHMICIFKCVKDAQQNVSNIQYHLVPYPASDSSIDFVTLLNAEGAQGFRLQRRVDLSGGFFSFANDPQVYVVLEKESRGSQPSTLKWDYKLTPITDFATEEYLKLVNQKGQNGFSHWDSLQFNDGSFDLFIRAKNIDESFVAHKAKFLKIDPSSNTILERLNKLGQKGFYFNTTFSDSFGSYIFLEKDLLEKPIKYSYSVVDFTNDQSAESLENELNTQAAQGYEFIKKGHPLGQTGFINLYQRCDN